MLQGRRILAQKRDDTQCMLGLEVDLVGALVPLALVFIGISIFQIRAERRKRRRYFRPASISRDGGANSGR